MTWSWQDPDWPSFRYQPSALAGREGAFLRGSGVVVGTTRHLPDDERLQLVVELIGTEALKTSEIEGEVLDRDSVQSSLRRQFGLQADARRVRPAELGIAEMLTRVYRTFAEPLTDEMLFGWHRGLMQGRGDLRQVGAYRTHPEPMQVISGPVHEPRVHFEAPPSEAVPREMDRFCAWFNATAPAGAMPLPALTRAGLAHLYFECIHPFEDGNGRIGRSIAEKALAQGTGQPSLTALSLILQRHRARYYRELEMANKTLEVVGWLDWFADRVLEAQAHTLASVEFILAKARLLDRLRGQLNARQEKALLRLMREGPEGFKGGLSAGKYSSLTGAPPATARRDLADLVALGALVRTGQLRGTRYWLPFSSPEEVADHPAAHS
jgi:Fic family protein